ncbi:benenodin family lasso peptide [Sphingopyxis sp. DBS4]|nr:benenodin family lasso peptide [Sphingopyxis sp. DBS4]
MERTNDLVELGSVSADTAGQKGLPFETGGLQNIPGLSQE